MARGKKNKKPTIASMQDQDLKSSIPKGIQYNALKGMSYEPSVKDLNKKARKQAKENLKKQQYRDDHGY